MPSFKEYESDYYTVDLFEPIVDFDKDQYGNEWFNVKFVGDAETFMWLKKDPPEEGKRYYGHIEKTKSGKRLRFKTDKVPDDAPKPPVSGDTPKADAKYQRDITALSLDVYRVVANIRGLPDNAEDSARFWDIVMSHTNELLDMIEKVRRNDRVISGSLGEVPTPKPAIKQEPASRNPATAPSLGDTYRQKRGEPELTDEDAPYEG